MSGIRHRLVLVEWVDSLGVGAAWQPIPDDLEAKALTCFSAGWLVAESEQAVVIVPHIHAADEGRGVVESGIGDMTIPRSAIVRLTDLQEG